MTPDLALYYCFLSPLSEPVNPAAPVVPLGSDAALDELLRIGCSLATKPWVENHWGLIMWKLAGMVCLDPDSESDPKTQRWSWSEVLSQLRFRYERLCFLAIRKN
jgi:breast cancer 2 susceptibility protein